MSQRRSPTESSGWRTSKACQECRKRKIKCNGLAPCKTCSERHTPCIYREIVRQRRKKQRDGHPGAALPEPSESLRPNASTRQPSPGQPQRPPGNYTFHNSSVSATHMASPSCQVQLYYGPTAHFAMMQQVYRDLVSSQASDEPQGEVEEAGAGLDLFSFRRIFFGTPSEAPGSGSHLPGAPAMFLSHGLAQAFLERFLSTLYSLMPARSKDWYEWQLDQLYQPPGSESDIASQAMIQLALAVGSLGTEHYGWGDALFERTKAALAALDEVHAHYQMEQGRPNSAFIHIGNGARKAIAAGLHKDMPSQHGDTSGTTDERRTTFWYLYFYEIWICFHLGRPSSLSLRDATIVHPDDPFLLVLLHLSKVVTRSADEIYGRRHESLLQMWKIARSISHDLQGYNSLMQKALGFGLDKSPQPGAMGVRQAMLLTLYYHTILLTFRPFLIFRGRWQRDMKSQEPGSNTANRPNEIPAWLNDACATVLNCSIKTIRHLCEAAYVNELVREVRYHGFFLGSASFALIYDLMHDQNLAASHLPWIHAGIWCLSTMRPGGPIESSIDALQIMLKKLNPSYEWAPSGYANNQQSTSAADMSPYLAQPSHIVNPQGDSMPPAFGDEQLSEPAFPILPNLQMTPVDTPIASVGSGEDLLDLRQSDMGWDFDLSTMDLEEFFSVYPNTGFPAF